MVTVRDVLSDARALGFLGPGPVDRHIVHAQEFARAVPVGPPGHVVDLGSGGGVPGLVLAHMWTDAELCLVEAGERRASFLEEAVARLGLRSRVRVIASRAEEVGRDPAFRALADAVVARSFGPPGVTAECAGPLLRVGGHLIVSEPPEVTIERWPEDSLAALGLVPLGRSTGEGGTVQVLRQVAPCPERFPRRVGVPAKRPLF